MIIPLLGLLLFIFALAFVGALFSSGGGIFALLLEIGSKQETLEFIGLGMGSVLAVMGAVALHQRAEAAMKNAEAMTKNAEVAAKNYALTEEGHIQERFKAAVQSLGHAESFVRIAAYYQFYHLAVKNSDMSLIRIILNILCARLRHITSKTSYYDGEGKEKPTDECQCLLNIIFLNPENLYAKNIFAGIYKDLRCTYLVGADLRFANADKASFCNAKLRRAVFNDAGLRGAHFAGANMEETKFIRAKMENSKFVLPNYPRANIGAADFRYAELYGADLSSVDNGQATIGLSSALVDKTTKPPCGYYLFQTDDGDYWLRKGSPP